MSTERATLPAHTATAPAPHPAVEPYRLDDQVGHLLRRAYQRASANLAAALAPHELTVAQYAVVARLAETGPMSQNALGRAVAMEPANIHAIVRRLRARGLVATRRDATDRRRRVIALAPAARHRLAALHTASHAATAATLAPLDAVEAGRLQALLARLAG